MHFEDGAFAIYQQLLDSLDFDQLDDESKSSLAVSHQLVRGEQQGLQGKLLDEIGRSLRTLLEERAKQLDRPPNAINPAKVPLTEYLGPLLSALVETTDLAAKVEDHLSEKIKWRVTVKRKLYGFYDVLKKQILQEAESDTPSIFPLIEVNSPLRHVPDPDWNAFKTNIMSGPLEQLVKERELEGCASLAAYRPSFAPRKNATAPPFSDHGLASGLLYAQICQAWHRIFSAQDTPLKTLLGLRGAAESSWQSIKPDHTPAHEILYSIFVHNLYPDFFNNEQLRRFRTRNSKSEAFAFFALLCDSLQPWDRKRLMNQGTGTPPYTTYAENFNLEVNGGFLQVTERDLKSHVEDRESELRRYLDSYLAGASKLVKLNLSEFRDAQQQ